MNVVMFILNLTVFIIAQFFVKDNNLISNLVILQLVLLVIWLALNAGPDNCTWYGHGAEMC